MTALRVVVDGEAMKDGDAIALWHRFSTYMDEHKGDLAGFAALEGFASIHPAMDKGLPMLVASRSAAQKPYASVERGGSSVHPVGGNGPSAAAPNGGKKRKRR